MKTTLSTTSAFICLLSMAFTASAQRSATPDSTWNQSVITPQCNASASPASITVGQQSTIASTGCGAPTNPVNQYQWTVTNSGPAMSGAGGTATFLTAGTFCYSIRGASVDGWGKPSPSACVNVSAVSLPAPACTLTATPASIGVGATSVFGATCSNVGSFPFYSWTIPASAPAFAGTGGNGTFNSVGTFLYSLTVWNGIAWSSPTSVAVTVSALPPLCTVLPDLSTPTICPAGFSGLYTTTQTFNTGTCSYNPATNDQAISCLPSAPCAPLPTIISPGNLCPVGTTGTFTTTQTFNSVIPFCVYNAPTDDRATACTVLACVVPSPVKQYRKIFCPVLPPFTYYQNEGFYTDMRDFDTVSCTWGNWSAVVTKEEGCAL